jgi:hypothetical protein
LDDGDDDDDDDEADVGCGWDMRVRSRSSFVLERTIVGARQRGLEGRRELFTGQVGTAADERVRPIFGQ